MDIELYGERGMSNKDKVNKMTDEQDWDIHILYLEQNLFKKPAAKFTKNEWRIAAFFFASLLPVFKKKGAPRKQQGLYKLVEQRLNTKNRPDLLKLLRGNPSVGRPQKLYYGKPISEIVTVLDKTGWSATKLLRKMEEIDRLGTPRRSGWRHDPEAVKRAIRRYRADKTKQ